jgi:hypothetical protein
VPWWSRQHFIGYSMHSIVLRQAVLNRQYVSSVLQTPRAAFILVALAGLAVAAVSVSAEVTKADSMSSRAILGVIQRLEVWRLQKLLLSLVAAVRV